MIILYLLFCIVVGLIYRKTNVIYALLLGIFGLDFFLNGNSLIKAAQTIVAIPKVVVQNPPILFLNIIIIQLFILSNLFKLINIVYLIDYNVSKLSDRKQKFIILFITFFSTNLDFSNSDIEKNHKSIYDLNSGITPFLNPISIYVIFISTLLLMFTDINKLNANTVPVLILINIPVIWWTFKTILQILYKKVYNYEIKKDNMELIRPSIDVEKINLNKPSINSKEFFRNCAILFVPALAFMLIMPGYRFYILIISYLLLVIIYTVYLGVKIVYEERTIAEEQIYITIKNSILGVGIEILSFMLTLMFTSLSYDFIERFYANNYSAVQLYMCVLITILIGILIFKDYLVAIALSMPIILIWTTSNYSIDSQLISIIYISLISIVSLAQIFLLIDFRCLRFEHYVDILMLSSVTVCVIVSLIYGRFVLGFIVFLLFQVAYIFIIRIINIRIKNDRIRYSQQNCK